MKLLKSRQPGICLEFVRRRTIFLHVPKCAGSSISLNLLGYQVGHANYRTYSKRLGQKINSYYVFSIVRNPVDRFKSAFAFLSQGGMSDADKSFAHRNARYLDPSKPNELLLALYRKKLKHMHFLPMTEFIKDYDGNIKCSYVHHIEAGTERLREKLETGVGGDFASAILDGLSPDNQRNRTEANVEFGDLDLDLLSKVYSEDFWRLGYERPTKNGKSTQS